MLKASRVGCLVTQARVRSDHDRRQSLAERVKSSGVIQRDGIATPEFRKGENFHALGDGRVRAKRPWLPGEPASHDAPSDSQPDFLFQLNSNQNVPDNASMHVG